MASPSLTLLGQVFISAILIATPLYILTYDNTDKTYLQQGIPNQKLQENFIKNVFQVNAKMEDFAKENKNYCLNGKDKKLLTPSQQHEEFVKGPCAPIIFLPGILGTQLHVVIDCEVMQSENPEAFSSCGWNTCSNWNILYKRPPKEFQVWIGSITSPAQIVSLSEKSKCFGNLINLSYNKQTNKFENQKGFYITWAGNTPETKSQSNCGVYAITNFINIPMINVATCVSGGYSRLVYTLEAMGYQSGLTFQAIPFDFRLTVQQSETQVIIPKAIDHMYKMTGKKSVILGYSLSTLHVVESMTSMPQQEKDEKVKTVLLIAPPLMGADKTLMNLLGGDPQYLVQLFGYNVGMNFFTQYNFVQACASSLDALPRNVFEKFKNDAWMKELIERIKYEKNKLSIDSLDKIPYDYILPNKDDVCIDSNIFTHRKGTEKCITGIYNQLEEYILKVDQKEIYATQKDIDEIISKYSIYDNEELMIKYKQSLESKGINNLINPQVPIAIIYGSYLEVEKQLIYNQNTKQFYNDSQTFYFPDKINKVQGDGTVPAFSSIIPGLKWAYEYENKIIKDAKPIKFIEFCSINKQSSTIYDGEDQNKEKVFNKNAYQGLTCECLEGSRQQQCNHSCLNTDKYMVKLIADAIKTNEKSKLKEIKFTDEELINIQQECPVLTK
ncbi:lecithin-cholesterol acyltransferase, putative [Ichthyophthirius multifiliis]|uniref:Lecithin-cholesterol acyltransferase, putative n=1 Tax=Ichthyophthirius multifiliis TaxID=5932 RepID=G0QYV3_ICHMU|nr:lecithin-cholesterol acyltransferase, putative [Ichthyophthirius multifiliis]EGR29598.1 lecithin-cholesterol acyltransferase, putative [Ichthyophthirius multifiliis]|eukprot:XP_004030834.1 lecithin-cholesterol acyltransferase, putative [Ichthyophthirius multifiliis]